MPNTRHAILARRAALMLCLAAGACAPASPASVSPASAPPASGSHASAPAPADDPRAMLERAIAQAGGAEALGRARALLWDGEATVHAGGRTVHIAGSWGVQPPDTAVVSTYDVSRGPESTRALIVAVPRGWIARDTAVTRMPDAMFANERDEFYLYDVMRLVPLREPRVTLHAIPADSLGQAGFRAERPGRPVVELYFDPSGRLAHLRTHVQDPGGAGGPAVQQDLWLSGTLQAGSIRWPASIRITMAGAPYFDLTLRNLRVQPRLDDPRLRGP
ncbi:MAG TPA: hypothetical protein VFT45_01885 [Longimicrobium sp.]|nr:hypothetical protein [Longimicrobium sp.]